MMTQSRNKGYFAYAELLFTLAMMMWTTVWHTEATDLNRTPRIIELVLFAIIGVACIAIAVIKGRLNAKEIPWLWKAAAGYCAGVLVVLFALGGFSVVRILALVAWVVYEIFLYRAAKRR